MTEHRASEPASDLDTFRSYLGLLARMQMPAQVQARLDTSDIEPTPPSPDCYTAG